MKTMLKRQILAGVTAAAALAIFSTPAFAASTNPKGPGTSGTVTVDNPRGVPVDVFVEQQGLDIRLGKVAAHSDAVLSVPAFLENHEPVQVVVRPRNGVIELASPHLLLTEGKNLDVYVSPDVGERPPVPEETVSERNLATTTLTVDNPSNHDVAVFMERGAFDARLGTVPADQSRTFPVPSWLTAEGSGVDVFVQPARGVGLGSQLFNLTRGAHLLVTVPSV